MNDLQLILNAFESIKQQSETAFLVTVVSTNGSTYRQPGARMLITQAGETIGLVSGGCLEQDIVEHTRQRMQSHKSMAITYDTTHEDDLIWGFALGCQGTVQVLVERLQPENLYSPLTELAQCWHDRSPRVLASIFQTEGSINIKLGAYFILTSDEVITFEATDSNLVNALATDAQAVFEQRQSRIQQYDLATGRVEVFLEFIQPPTSLIIFGAGQDVLPVAQFAKVIGWQVTVVDCRANPASYDRFASAERVILTRREILHEILIDPQTVAVVMTHNYLDDQAILKMLLTSSARYIGALGPKRRTERLLQDLQAEGLIYSKVQLERLYAPVGLDIGAETPEEIALSILAEIQAVLSERAGGSLKHRPEPIHSKNFNESTHRWFDSTSSRSFNPHGETQTTAGVWGT